MTKSVFGFKEPEDSPGFMLWQTTITWQRLIKSALDPYNISHAQFVVLAVTLWFQGKNQEISQSLIIQQSKLDKMTVSKSLKKLVSEGYVRRTEHKSDTRAKCVYLTKRGKDLISNLIPIVEKIDANFFGILGKNEESVFKKMLSKIVSNVPFRLENDE